MNAGGSRGDGDRWDSAGRIATLERDLAAARRTIEVLIERIERTEPQSHRGHALFQTMAELERAVEERTRSLERSQTEIQRYSDQLENLVAERTAALRASMERYQGLFDNAAEAILILSREGVVEAVNPEAIRASGFPANELIGMTARDFVDEEERERVLEAIRRASQSTGSVRSLPLRIRRKDGEELFVELNISLMRDPDGHAIGYQVTGRDVSERVALQEALLSAQKLETLGSLAAGIAHDFNNVLAAIMPAAERIQQEIKPGHPLERYVESIARAGQHAAGLTAQLLAFTRHGPTNERVLDPGMAVAKGVDLASALFTRGVHVDNRLPPATTVRVDPTRFEQVVLNLLVNAREASGEGGRVTVSLDLVELTSVDAIIPPLPAGRYVRLVIEDDGPGMDPEVASRVFEPFFTTRVVGKGTGLGLAVVYTVVEQSGGGVNLSTAPGEGARFEIYLPADEEEILLSTGDLVVPTLGGRILVVEDDEVLRGLVVDLLQEMEFETTAVPDGIAALDVMRTRGDEFDVVLLDLRMPYMSGGEVLDAIREQYSQMPVILSSGFIDGEEREAMMRKPRTAFLQKPYRLPALSAAINKVRSEDD